MATANDPNNPVQTNTTVQTALPQYNPTPVPPPASSQNGGGGLLSQTVGTTQQPQPPIDPHTYENDNVTSILNDITSQDNDYMKLARTSGLQTANKRGLLNSSLAAQSSQAAALQAAAPLAQTQAQIAGARNLERVQSAFAGERQAADIASREGMLASQLSNEQLLQTRDIANRLQMQNIDITNQQAMQKAQLDAQQQLAEMNIAAESERLGRQLTAQEKLQQQDLAAQQARLAMSIASQEKQTTDTLSNQWNMAQLDATTRTQLMALSNASEEQRAALQYFLGQDQIYAQGIAAMWQNAEMPAPARNQAMNQLLALKNSGIDLPAALFGLQFHWPTGTGGSSPTTGGPAPIPPTTTPITQGAYYTGPSKNEIMAMQHDGVKGNYAAAVQAWNAAHPNDPIAASSGGGGGGFNPIGALTGGLLGGLFG